MTDTSIINSDPSLQVESTSPSSDVSSDDVKTDDVFDKLKSLLVLAGHEIGKEWDLAVAYAKALAEK